MPVRLIALCWVVPVTVTAGEILQQLYTCFALCDAAGSESDWVLDLVATGFDKPAALFENSMRSTEDIMEAAKAFKQHYLTSLAVSCWAI